MQCPRSRCKNNIICNERNRMFLFFFFSFVFFNECESPTRSADCVFDQSSHVRDFAFYFIRKTCPCYEYPLKPHFYIEKLGFAGVYLIFLFLLQNIDCGYSLEPPRRGGSNVYPQSMFRAKIRKISKSFY